MSAIDSHHNVGDGRLGFASQKDVDLFIDKLGQFERGEIGPDEWRAFRLVNGVYGQRQEGVTMIRVKIPGGIVNAAQLRYFAHVAETYAEGRGHVTTRQNVQFHFVKLEHTETILRGAADLGLTTREACGNSVRTITASPYAGVSPNEPFDTTPYADALTRHLLRGKFSSTLPRKFKIAFGGADGGADDVGAAFHDLGFLARVDSQGNRGFRLTIGGGLATLRRNGLLAHEFLPVDQLLETAEAVVRVFHRTGDRQHRHKARLKFVIDRLGPDAFLAEYRAELEKVRADGPRELHLVPQPPEPVLPPVAETSAHEVPSRFLATAVRSQKQPGFVSVTLRLHLGDLSAAQFRALADAAETFSGEREIRFSYEQNVVLRFVDRRRLGALHAFLATHGLANDGANTIADITSCPGAMSCKLSVTASRGLASLLAETLENKPELKTLAPDLVMKASGCPNSCGQHHVAAIGWQGGMKKVNGRPAPTYHLYLGGGVDPDKAHFGKLMAKIPARRAGDALEALVRLYAAQKQDGEKPDAFFRRLTSDDVKAALAHVGDLTPANVTEQDFIDLGETRAFEVVDGEGECAA